MRVLEMCKELLEGQKSIELHESDLGGNDDETVDLK
jgi:hypothetical protein